MRLGKRWGGLVDLRGIFGFLWRPRAIIAVLLAAGLAYMVVGSLFRVQQADLHRAADFNKKSCANIHASAMAEAETDEPPARCVTVYFATNRQVRGRSPAGPSFSAIDGFRNIGLGVFASKLVYGRAEVSMPHLAIGDKGERKRGDSDTAPEKQPGAYEDLEKYVALTTISMTSQETQFYPALKTAIADAYDAALEKAAREDEEEDQDECECADSEENDDSDGGDDDGEEIKKQVLLFVHGYNVEFDDAVIRAAQLAVDLTFDEESFPDEQAFEFGPPVLFSWPNFGREFTYPLDIFAANRSVSKFEKFLFDLVSKSEADTINIVVHSMGNRVLVKSLEGFVDDFVKENDLADIEFRIVHAAADVDRELYNDVMDKIKDKAFNAEYTIYASEQDRALSLSQLVNFFAEPAGRLGQIINGDIYIRETDDEEEKERFTSIDATGFATDLFGHGYFSNAGNIVSDISCYLEGRAPIDRALIPRSLIEKNETGEEVSLETYWEADSSKCGNCAIERARDFITDEQARSGIRSAIDRVGPGGPPSAQFRLCDDGSSVPVASQCAITKPGEYTGETPDPVLFAVYFAYKSTELTDEARATIAAYAEYILQYDIYQVDVIGYADAVGPEEYNLALSQRRAEIVGDALIDAGVPADLVYAYGRGEDDAEDEPLSRRADEESDAERRRVDVVVEFQ